jgi:hypothetical protein
MLGDRYLVVTVECPHCKTKQKVHVDVQPSSLLKNPFLLQL